MSSNSTSIHPTPTRRRLARIGAATVAAGAIVATAATPASAHVTVTPSGTAAGGHTVLTFSVPHGCEASPTTEVAIKLPEEIVSVTPTRNPLWDLEKVMVELDEPIEDSHGNQITERVDQVVYTTDQPLPDGQRDTFELSLQLPDAAGETLAFPVVQTCQKGEEGWTETAADGQDAEELEKPAPTVTITEATGDGHGADTASDTASDSGGEGADETTDAAADADSEDGNGLAIAGLVAGVLGILVGGIALARGGRKA